MITRVTITHFTFRYQIFDANDWTFIRMEIVRLTSTLAQQSICALCGGKVKFGEYQFTEYGAVLICKDCMSK